MMMMMKKNFEFICERKFVFLLRVDPFLFDMSICILFHTIRVAVSGLYLFN